MFKQFLEYELFTLAGKTIQTQQLLVLILIVALLFFLWRFFNGRFLHKLFLSNDIPERQQKRINRLATSIFLVLVPVVFVWTFNLEFSLPLGQYGEISFLLLLSALLIYLGALTLDWIISNVFINKYYNNRDVKSDQSVKAKDDPKRAANRTVSSLVYILAAIILLRAFKLDFTIFTYEHQNNVIPFRITNIFQALFVLIIAKILIWFIVHILLYGYYKQKKINIGAQYAINKLVAYVLYVVASIFALQTLGINMTLIWGGAAALLVGIGLGLQQTFNDFFSGIVLLFERSVEVGDILNVDGKVGTVKKIGIRSSILETLENVSMVVPNSTIVNQNVNNWTHLDNKIRFKVELGVAYGSDVQKVKEILIEVATGNKYILQKPEPLVRFFDFGDSALVFHLLFFSRNFKLIEDVKSDLRFEINRLFKENNITIPFPQRDVWLKKES